jgi:diguanylate cyclase (GGDEF)-like protein
MSEKSSGAYVIDRDYNIVSCNQAIRELYPQLRVGEKCFKCLMGLDEPCPPCPVANRVYGPKTYLDPIRGIYETVDAVEMDLGDGRLGHALVVSTVGESEEVSARLPRTHGELVRLLEQKYYDSLTGAYSREGFIRETKRVIGQGHQTQYAIAMFDIRNFKAVNDAFGVEGGDEILRYVFNSLQSSWLQPAVSARLESDWFIFLVERERLRSGDLGELLNMEWSNEYRNAHLHLLCGIYLVEDIQMPVPRMVEFAILAKEATEDEESGNVAVFDEAMRKTYIDQAEMVSGFQNGIRNEDFKVFFQPIIGAEDGKVCSAEALVRWEHPTMGVIMPGLFIPALEKSGLVSELDRYVLRQVYAFQESLMEQGMKFVPVSVNLSRHDFYNDRLMSDIISLADTSGLPSGSVNFEVTETSVAELKQNCAYLLKQIQQAGAKVILDDFGSGYSSLGMIGDYSFDVIKIDKSFIDQIETRPTVRAVVTSTIDMCHKIGLKTVAEGVETRQQLDLLKEFNCDYIQGYYYSKPMSEESFLEYLTASQDAVAQSDRRIVRVEQPAFDLYNLIDLVDHSGLFIQVCHPEDHTMVFANEMTRLVSGHPAEPYHGKKCYEYMLGLNAPCGHCPMKQMRDELEKDIEVDDGEHVFALKARYSKWNGKNVFIEYGRDVTSTKVAQRRYTSHIRSILENIPDGQGVFHVDLTADRWLSSGGKAKNARDMQDIEDVDTLIRRIASFVPDAEGQERFFQTFSRASQLEASDANRHQIVLETKSYFDDRSIRWSRITAQLINNPNNGHVESVIYGVDISKERTRVEELERERRRRLQEREELENEVRAAWDMYTQADRDRRYDFLTGLNSRLELHEVMDQAAKNSTDSATAVMMMDIDGLKKVNEEYGHSAGDRCLKVLGETVQDFGVKHNVSFYRYSGEEIVGLAYGEEGDIPLVASELLHEVRDMRISLDNATEIAMTVSIGYTTRVSDYYDMLDRADRAMYAAKRRGKNQVACIDGGGGSF